MKGRTTYAEKNSGNEVGRHQTRRNGTKRDTNRNNEKNGTADETTDNLLPRPRVQGEVASIAALPKWLRREMQYLTSP